jgi:hypothetical protein
LAPSDGIQLAVTPVEPQIIATQAAEPSASASVSASLAKVMGSDSRPPYSEFLREVGGEAARGLYFRRAAFEFVVKGFGCGDRVGHCAKLSPLSRAHLSLSSQASEARPGAQATGRIV